MFLHKKCCKIFSTLRYERLAFSKRRKGGLVLNNTDLILHLVEELIAEKEKNYKLQQEKQQQQMQENIVKTKM